MKSKSKKYKNKLKKKVILNRRILLIIIMLAIGIPVTMAYYDSMWNVISTIAGATPFWINSTLYPQPNTTTGLTKDQSFRTGWVVNATGKGLYYIKILANTSNINIADNTSTNQSVEVFSKGIIPNVKTLGEPFFVQSGDSNPKICNGEIRDGTNCKFSANINATGATGNYTVFFLSNSTNPNVATNQSTNNQVVNITTYIAPECNITFNWTSANFGAIAHNSQNNPATNNYSLSANTSATCNCSINWNVPSPPLTSGSYNIPNQNLKLNYTKDGTPYNNLQLRNLTANASVNPSSQSMVYPKYWLDVPNQQQQGSYQGSEIISSSCL